MPTYRAVAAGCGACFTEGTLDDSFFTGRKPQALYKVIVPNSSEKVTMKCIYYI